MRRAWIVVVLAVLGTVYGCDRRPLREQVWRPLAATNRTTIAGETRRALEQLPPPGVGLTRFELPLVPPGARLEVAYGVAPEGWNPTSSAVTFHVLVAGQAIPLFYARLDPAASPSQRRWFTAEVDLSRFAGLAVTVVLQTALHRAADRHATSTPVWGEPLVFSPAQLRPRRNLLLVAFEGVRRTDLGAYGSERPTSPNFDALAKESVVFDQALTHATSDHPSLVSLLTGLYPRAHRILRAARGNDTNRFLTLSEALAREGYVSGAITVSANLAGKTAARGFDWFRTSPTTETDERQVVQAATDAAANWIATHRAVPWLLLVHAGVSASPPAPTMSKPEELDRHDAAVFRADETLGRLWRDVGALGLADDTMLVVTSDYGYPLDRGTSDPGALLRGEMLRVPLLIRTPDRKPGGQRIGDQVGLIDVMPTVLALLGAAPAPQAQGLSLAPLFAENCDRAAAQHSAMALHAALAKRPLFADALDASTPNIGAPSLAYTWRMPVLKIIWTPARGGNREHFEAYDLANDPQELHDVFDERFALHREALARYARTGQPFPAEPFGPYRRLP